MSRYAIANVFIRVAERIGAALRPTAPPVTPARRDGGQASVVILNWKRPRNVSRILDAYVQYSCLDDIIVWSDNPKTALAYGHPKVRCIESDGCGLNCRWLACLIAHNQCVIVNDDDILCAEATIRSLIEWHMNDPHRTYTLHGRNPNNHNEYSEFVERVRTPVECEMHLTRVACINRRFVPHYFTALHEIGLTVDPQSGGGEDIAFSYVVTRETGRKPLVVPGAYTELLARHAINNRPGHLVHRTEIMRRCQVWLRQSRRLGHVG